MDNQDILKLDNQICFAFYACSREITKLYRPMLEKIDLTYTQYVTMLALWEEDHVTVTALGNKLYLDSGTLTPLLKKLEAAGHLTRTRDRNDERSVLVELTAQGRALRELAVDFPNQLACKLDGTPEEAAGLLAITHQFLQKIQQSSNKE
ncbi:DNA-binding MarR family transcriptional regulator [Paenibacillus endophyticus]|uniref:DNA-binding MarR family transcriptional regulator n=1 Tax=Paenibacillus endophyticus TaxID=1294268 RepID=A0A7W5C8S4_9BACL|nr:MarR family transcriptional regulator [Paenibacillus endophyticus]MBB3153228.1 DNA-binding MarR family transcriptional regulator [Paenibacillus endophyticus]